MNGNPCIKLSEEFNKVSFPGKKEAYRLYDRDMSPLVDILTKADEPAPQVGVRTLCRHPFQVLNPLKHFNQSLTNFISQKKGDQKSVFESEQSRKITCSILGKWKSGRRKH